MAQAQLQHKYPRPAQESIAQCYALFGCQSQSGVAYDNLSEHMKKVLCFASGLKQRHIEMKLKDMNHIERAKLHKTINMMADAIKPIAYSPLKDFK